MEEGSGEAVQLFVGTRLPNALDRADSLADLDLPGARLHALQGDRKGFFSLELSGNWRLVFRFEDGDAYDVEVVDYHRS